MKTTTNPKLGNLVLYQEVKILSLHKRLYKARLGYFAGKLFLVIGTCIALMAKFSNTFGFIKDDPVSFVLLYLGVLGFVVFRFIEVNGIFNEILLAVSDLVCTGYLAFYQLPDFEYGNYLQDMKLLILENKDRVGFFEFGDYSGLHPPSFDNAAPKGWSVYYPPKKKSIDAYFEYLESGRKNIRTVKSK